MKLAIDSLHVAPEKQLTKLEKLTNFRPDFINTRTNKFALLCTKITENNSRNNGNNLQLRIICVMETYPADWDK